MTTAALAEEYRRRSGALEATRMGASTKKGGGSACPVLERPVTSVFAFFVFYREMGNSAFTTRRTSSSDSTTGTTTYTNLLHKPENRGPRALRRRRRHHLPPFPPRPRRDPLGRRRPARRLDLQ